MKQKIAHAKPALHVPCSCFVHFSLTASNLVMHGSGISTTQSLTIVLLNRRHSLKTVAPFKIRRLQAIHPVCYTPHHKSLGHRVIGANQKKRYGRWWSIPQVFTFVDICWRRRHIWMVLRYVVCFALKKINSTVLNVRLEKGSVSKLNTLICAVDSASLHKST